MNRMSKAERHWRHFARLHNSSHAKYIRYIRTWERFFGVYPRGYSLDSKGQLNFEKAKR